MKYLYINIIKLINNVDNVDWFTENDLYILVKYGSQVRQTTVKLNSIEPIWNESFIFEQTEENKNIKKIIFEIYDYNKWTPSQKLATDMISINNNELLGVSGKYLEILIGNLLLKSENEIKSLKNQIETLNFENINYGEDNDTLIGVNISLNKENEQLKTQINKLQKSNTILEDENDTLENKNKTLEDQNETLENKNKTLEDENETLEDENDSLEDENDKKEETNKSFEIKYSSLNEEFGDLKLNYNKLNDIYKITYDENIELVDKNNTLINEKDTLYDKNSLLVRKNIQLTNDLTNINNKFESIKDLLDA